MGDWTYSTFAALCSRFFRPQFIAKTEVEGMRCNDRFMADSVPAPRRNKIQDWLADGLRVCDDGSRSRVSSDATYLPELRRAPFEHSHNASLKTSSTD